MITGVAHHVAHQAHKRQVDRFADGIAQRGNAVVVLAAEVVEVMHATTGKKTFAGVGGILTVERGIQHGGQLCLGIFDQVRQRPAGDRVLVGGGDFFQRGTGLAAIAVMQFGNDLQIGGQHPQLGSGAQLQFAAFIDIEGLVGAVGLHPGPCAVRGQLEQGEAVAYLCGAGGGQEVGAEQADFPGKSGICQLAQIVADLALQVALQGAGG